MTPRRTAAAPVARSTEAGAALTGSGREQLPHRKHFVNDPTNGIWQGVPDEDRPPGSWGLLINARSRRRYLERREGTRTYAGIIGSNRVIGLFTAFLQENTWLVRTTKATIKISSEEGIWIDCPGPGFQSERQQDATTSLNWMFITSPTDRLKYVDFNAKIHARVPGAPTARFCEAFADRIVVANIKSPSGGQVGTNIAWSANGDPFEWDPLVNESAGSDFLESAPSDQGDEITGLHILGDSLVILRERSVWLAVRQGIASAPFRFLSLISGVGCDLPHSSVKIPGGLMWADRATNGIYLMAPGGLPQKISSAIRPLLFRGLLKTPWVKGTYDRFWNEYHLGMTVDLNQFTGVHNLPIEVDPETINLTWVYSIETKSFQFDMGPNGVSTLSVGVGGEDEIQIDDLVGTIDAQIPDPNDPLKPNPSGVVDDWGSDLEALSSVFKGTVDGKVLIQEGDRDYDGTPVEMIAESQNLGGDMSGWVLKDSRYSMRAPLGGRVLIDYSNEDRRWGKRRTIVMPGSGQYFRYDSSYKQKSGERIYLRIVSAVHKLQLINWGAKLLRKTGAVPRSRI
ncbi:MAG: hypothetical protein GY906_37070 [bacterium]|nr:hypothetical protein [bacterium]